MAGIHKRSTAFARISILLSVLLFSNCISSTNGFVSRNPSRICNPKDLALKSVPKVQKPENFVRPEPKPLKISESTDIGRFTRNSLAFVFRLGVGAFVLGWKIDTIFYKDDETEDVSKKKYSLKLGPFAIRDTSSVLSAGVPRPEKPLVLYEYDASPYCKRVREFINLLDLTVEYRPCPGARQGKFSDELYEKTGRRTVSHCFYCCEKMFARVLVRSVFVFNLQRHCFFSLTFLQIFPQWFGGVLFLCVDSVFVRPKYRPGPL